MHLFIFTYVTFGNRQHFFLIELLYNIQWYVLSFVLQFPIQQGRVSAQESRIFWLALVLFPMVWGLLFMFALFGFKFKWLVSWFWKNYIFFLNSFNWFNVADTCIVYILWFVGACFHCNYSERSQFIWVNLAFSFSNREYSICTYWVLKLIFCCFYRYIKCNYGSNANLNSAATDFVRKQVFRNAFDFMSKPSQPTTTGPSGIV